jgi:hypothetical protein
VWFPTVKSMALLVVRAQINEGAAEALARALVDYGDGRDISEGALAAAFASVATTAPASVGTTAPAVAPAPSSTVEPTP